MSAPLKDPLVVNTQDNRCWVRRAWSQDGHGLYGLEGSPQDVEQTLFLLRELAEYGLRSMVDVLPVQVSVPDGITRRIAPTQAMQVEDPCHPCGCPKRFNRHADGCPTLPEGEHYAAVHHAYRVPRDLPETGGAR